MTDRRHDVDSQEFRFLVDKIAVRRAAGGSYGDLQARLRELCERKGWKVPKEAGHG